MFSNIANFLVFNLLGLEVGKLSESLIFFIADTLKIFTLMIAVITVISFIRTLLPTEKLQAWFHKARFGISHLCAAFLGSITPFCSCSSIPLFLGFLEAKAPTGVAFAFLATSPLVNEVVFVIMGSTFGWKIAGIYAVSGIILGVAAGLIIEKILGNKAIKISGKGENIFGTQGDLPTVFRERVKYSVLRGFKIFRTMWWIILIGVAVGAGIHGFVPAEFFLKVLGESSGIWGVPAAVALGVPIYARSASIVPVIFALTEKGLQLGTALALMMSAAGLSAPEAIILKRVLSGKTLVTFFGVVAVGIVLLGFIFNFLI
ncbi:MAG: permease [Patescibacteria group bacterium]